MKISLQSLQSTLLRELHSALRFLQSPAFQSLRTYCLATQGYLQNHAMQDVSVLFPAWEKIMQLSCSDLTEDVINTVCREKKQDNASAWLYLLEEDSRELLVDELSLLESFVMERSRQAQNAGLVVCADTVIESRIW